MLELFNNNINTKEVKKTSIFDEMNQNSKSIQYVKNSSYTFTLYKNLEILSECIYIGKNVFLLCLDRNEVDQIYRYNRDYKICIENRLTFNILDISNITPIQNNIVVCLVFTRFDNSLTNLASLQILPKEKYSSYYTLNRECYIIENNFKAQCKIIESNSMFVLTTNMNVVKGTPLIVDNIIVGINIEKNKFLKFDAIYSIICPFTNDILLKKLDEREIILNTIKDLQYRLNDLEKLMANNNNSTTFS